MKTIKLALTFVFLLLIGAGSAFADIGIGAYFFPVTPKEVLNDHSNGFDISSYSAWRPDVGMINKEGNQAVARKSINLFPVCTAYLCILK